MIKNYFKSAWRNLSRHKFISFINIFGLTIGLACCLVIVIYIINEVSYDKFNANASRTYRITRTFYNARGVASLHLSAIAPAFGPVLQSAFPEIQKMTRLLSNGTTALHYREKLFNEKNAYFADESFFSIFSVGVVKGDKHTGLNDPYTVMMTEAVAKKYFGGDDPINKTLLLDNTKHGFKVTGIFKPFPSNSHLHPELLMSFNTLRDTAVYGEKQLETSFDNNSFYTYFLLPENYNSEMMNRRLPAFLDKYVHLQGMPANVKTSQSTRLELQKLTDIHLRSHLDSELEENGDITRVYIFSVIAVFILIIACINYMNLSTARSVLRAKEIGVRKAIGAQRQEITRQFLSESVLVTAIALICALLLTWVLLPLLNQVSGLHLEFSTLFRYKIGFGILLVPFVIGLLSGIYPAVFMSSFNPVKVLKGIVHTGADGISFRKLLVVLQFCVSIILLIATAVVFEQLHYIQKKGLGFNKEHVVNMTYTKAITHQFESFRQELLKNPAIHDVGRSSQIPTERLTNSMEASVTENGVPQPIKTSLKFITADFDFIPTYGIEVAAGRNFSRDFPTDTSNFLINETAVQALGWRDARNAIGKDLNYGGLKGKIIGVVKDFHFESLHQTIIPLLFLLPAAHSSFYHNLSIKIDGNQTMSAIATIEQEWHKFLPDVPFDYTFLDEKFQQLYNSEQQQGKLFTLFSCLAIFIACLGLFGLSAFTISRRVKEIGIRKVLGAGISQIVIELSTDFMKLVLAAAAIALPIAGLLMHQWLQNFAFRVGLEWWVFLAAGVLAMVIAFATISVQAVKAAMTNPVKSLRSE